LKIVLVCFIILISFTLLVGEESENLFQYRQFETFQRIHLTLSKDSVVDITENKEGKFIEVTIEKFPGSPSSALQTAIKKGEVVEKFSWTKKGGKVVVKIFVKPEKFMNFHGFNRVTGELVLDVGKEKNYTIVTDKNRTDIKLSKLYIDSFSEEKDIKSSLIIHTFNYYFSRELSLPLLRPSIERSTIYPFLDGADRDIELYNRALRAYMDKAFTVAEKNLGILANEYLKTPVFAVADFLEIDMKRDKMIESGKFESHNLLDLYYQYRIAVAIYPNSYMTPWGYFMMGELLYKLEMLPEGANAFRQVIERYPDSNLYNLAILKHSEYLMQAKKYKDVIELLSKMDMSENSEEITGKNALMGICYILIGEEKSGFAFIEKIKKGEALMNFDDNLLMTAGELMLVNKKYETARKFYTEILENHKESPYVSAASFRIGDTYLATGSSKAAVTKYQETLNNFRSKEGGRLSRLQIYEVENHRSEEEFPFEIYFDAMKRAKTNFEYSVILFKMSMKYYRSGNIANAVQTLALLIEKFPRSLSSRVATNISYDIFRNSIRELYRKDNFVSIVNFFQMIPEFMIDMPDIINMFVILGKSFNRISLYDSSAKVFNEILRTDEGDEPVLKSISVLNLFDNYILAENRLKAEMTMDYYSDFMQNVDTVYPVFLRLQGDYYDKLGEDSVKALEYYKKALDAEPYPVNKLIISLRIAEIYFREKNTEKAIIYSRPVYNQFKVHSGMFDFLERGAFIYTMSYLMRDDRENFRKSYDAVHKNMHDETKESFELYSALILVSDGKMKEADKKLESAKFKTLAKMAEGVRKKIKESLGFESEAKRVEESLSDYVKQVEELEKNL